MVDNLVDVGNERNALENKAAHLAASLTTEREAHINAQQARAALAAPKGLRTIMCDKDAGPWVVVGFNSPAEAAVWAKSMQPERTHVRWSGRMGQRLVVPTSTIKVNL